MFENCIKIIDQKIYSDLCKKKTTKKVFKKNEKMKQNKIVCTTILQSECKCSSIAGGAALVSDDAIHIYIYQNGYRNIQFSWIYLRYKARVCDITVRMKNNQSMINFGKAFLLIETCRVPIFVTDHCMKDPLHIGSLLNIISLTVFLLNLRIRNEL